ncbi:hypothetical protein NMY22_g10425 [Coprinellus aureogranulatus]|nr:hypothetical protein NMY22_g10425 [Coprinellus aureogranulatus]
MLSWQYYNMQSPGNCPISELMTALLLEEKSRQKIFDLLSGTGALSKRLVNAANLRFNYISRQTKDTVASKLEGSIFPRVSAADMMLTYLDLTVDVIVKLCEHPTICSRLFKDGAFFETCTHAINTWVTQTDPLQEQDERVIAFRVATRVQTIIVCYRHRSASNWELSSQALQATVQGGAVDILVQALHSTSQQGREAASQMLQALLYQCDIRPSSSKAIHDKLLALLGPDFLDPTFIPIRECQLSWSSLCYDAQVFGSYEREDTAYLCDNLRCSGDNPSGERSRACSGCYAVLYCSSECQTEDWKSLHRYECSFASEQSLEDKRRDRPHYTLSTRLFHAEFTSRRSGVSIGTALEWHPTKKQKLAEQPCVVELGITLNPNVEIRTLEEYFRLRQDLPAHYYDRRARAIVEGLTPEEVKAGARIVEDVRKYGDRTLRILAKICRGCKMEASGNGWALYSTYEIGIIYTKFVYAWRSSAFELAMHVTVRCGATIRYTSPPPPPPSMLSLLRVAASLGIIKVKGEGTRTPIPTCIDGWNGLPEDIFNLILKSHLVSDVATARALSASCRAYATYSRSYIFRAIELADPKAVIEFNIVLNRYSWVVDMVHTLRITDDGKRMNFQAKGRRRVLKPLGKALVSILSHQYTQLKTLELPYLHGNHQWLALSKGLEDTISSFLSRHTLQEISLTSHYPLELLRQCQSIRKLEYRIFPDSDCHLVLSAVGPSESAMSPALVLRELVVQDVSSILSAFNPYLVHPSSSINLANLESLTYYGDRISTTQLPLFLQGCPRLSTLRIFVNGYEGLDLFLNLFHLTHLSHLTISMDCSQFDVMSADWIYRTIIDLKNSVGLTSDDQPLEQLQRLQFSVVVDKESWGSIGPEFCQKRLGMPSDLDRSTGQDELESQLLVQFMKDDRKRILEMADIGFLEDKFHRWLCL